MKTMFTRWTNERTFLHGKIYPSTNTRASCTQSFFPYYYYSLYRLSNVCKKKIHFHISITFRLLLSSASSSSSPLFTNSSAHLSAQKENNESVRCWFNLFINLNSSAIEFYFIFDISTTCKYVRCRIHTCAEQIYTICAAYICKSLKSVYWWKSQAYTQKSNCSRYRMRRM